MEDRHDGFLTMPMSPTISAKLKYNGHLRAVLLLGLKLQLHSSSEYGIQVYKYTVVL